MAAMDVTREEFTKLTAEVEKIKGREKETSESTAAILGQIRDATEKIEKLEEMNLESKIQSVSDMTIDFNDKLSALERLNIEARLNDLDRKVQELVDFGSRIKVLEEHDVEGKQALQMRAKEIEDTFGESLTAVQVELSNARAKLEAS